MTPSATSENNWGVVRLIANLPFRRRFLRPPSTKAPSLRRHYPASSVLRASPPSPTARPVSRELPVDPHRDHRWDFPCCAWSPLRTCRRQYPGRSDGTCSLVQFHSLRPSHETGAGRLLHHYFRGLLSVHSRYGLHARRVALATLCTRGFSSLVASTAVLIATGWSEPVPGRVYPRCGPAPSRRTRFARDTSRIDVKRGDSFLQADAIGT